MGMPSSLIQLSRGADFATLLVLVILFGAVTAAFLLLGLYWVRRTSTQASSGGGGDPNWRYLKKSIEQNREDIRNLDKSIKELRDRVRNLESRPPTTRDSTAFERSGRGPGWVSESEPSKKTSGEQPYTDQQNITDVPRAAKDNYHKLALEGHRSSVTHMFAVPYEGTDNRGIVVGDSPHEFRESSDKDTPFVIVIGDDGSAAWLFPNPLIYFTEAMKYVFPGLSREQFENNKKIIEPIPVRQRPDGLWEIT